MPLQDSPGIVMVAAENDALPGGKAGGVGDVVRDVPPLLAERGCRVDVITPAYGVFASLPGARALAPLEVPFRGEAQRVALYQVEATPACAGVRHFVLDHPQFAACGRGRIYCDDPPGRAFATDASKFALFCAAAARALAAQRFGEVAAVHLHDWHCGLVLALRRFDPACAGLRDVRCVFSIHNIALQGVRPLAGDESSFEQWFPELRYDVAAIADPRWPDCVNPMAIGIRCADAVHVVSPSYAEEVLRPSAVAEAGYYGGEGLEGDLGRAQSEGRLFGILNGCDYAAAPAGTTSWRELLALMRAELLRWAAAGDTLSSAHFLAHERLARLAVKRPAPLLTSVGRVTEQKLRLLREPGPDGRPALEGVLDALGDAGLYLLLGQGDADYERFLADVSARAANFIFLRGYSDALAQALYAQGDLFLMPSSFEPCGIGQMLAMRAGQPCLVHAVGGLRDTVVDDTTGFSFDGTSLTAQTGALLERLRAALELKARQPRSWGAIRRRARAARFAWTDSIEAYLERLYRLG